MSTKSTGIKGNLTLLLYRSHPIVRIRISSVRFYYLLTLLPDHSLLSISTLFLIQSLQIHFYLLFLIKFLFTIYCSIIALINDSRLTCSIIIFQQKPVIIVTTEIQQIVKNLFLVLLSLFVYCFGVTSF